MFGCGEGPVVGVALDPCDGFGVGGALGWGVGCAGGAAVVGAALGCGEIVSFFTPFVKLPVAKVYKSK